MKITLYRRWLSYSIRCQLITWHSSSADLNWTSTACLLPPTHLCHLFFSNFRSKAERSEPTCILSWYVCFEDIDESEKEREGGEACSVRVSEWWEREGGRERRDEEKGAGWGMVKGWEKREINDVTQLMQALHTSLHCYVNEQVSISIPLHIHIKHKDLWEKQSTVLSHWYILQQRSVIIEKTVVSMAWQLISSSTYKLVAQLVVLN